MAAADAHPDELHAFLKMRSFGDAWLAYTYLDRAFLQKKLFMYRVGVDPADTYANWAQLIKEHRVEWERERVPELMRLRDYFSFMQFAQQERVIVVVCGANPAAGRWIGQPRIACYGGALPIPSRETAPNDGLLAADPDDARLIELLRSYDPTVSYESYVELLRAHGLKVRPANEGYVVEDEAGRLLHEPYRLHGVYDAESNETAWTSKQGERLRASLNRHLGGDLVQFGPQDNWALRNDQRIAGPFFGPQTPVLVFDRDQGIGERLSPRKLAQLEPYRFQWDDLYPDSPIAKKGSGT
jgi:hypothetical protein